MRRLLALAPVVATLLACAPSAEEAPAAASADGLVTGGVCATLDYGPRPGVNDLYRFFADDAAVAANISSMLQYGILQGAVGPGATLRGVNDDARVVRLVGSVFEGFKQAFPFETTGLDAAPPVVVITSSVPNAFALGNTFENMAMTAKSPWFFVINTALLEHGNTDDELRAVFAHEIGHLVLQTFKPDVQARVRHAYTLGNGSEDGILGAAQADDPSLADPIGRLLNGQSRVGGVPQLGMNMLMPGAYFKVVSSMLRPTATTSSLCSGIQMKAQMLAMKQMSFLPGVREGNLVPRLPNAAEKAELDRMSDALAADVKACAAPNSDGTTIAIISAVLQQLSPMAAMDPSNPDYAKVRAGMLEIEKQIEQSQAPTELLSEQLVRADGLVRAELTAIRANAALNIPRVRVYDFEEDADDAAMRVLRAIGSEPEAIGTFALTMLSPASKSACLADIAAGKPIGYGELYDVHPLHCWRYYHAKQFNQAISSCEPTRSDKRAPLKTHLPFIAVDPMTVSGIAHHAE